MAHSHYQFKFTFQALWETRESESTRRRNSQLFVGVTGLVWWETNYSPCYVSLQSAIIGLFWADPHALQVLVNYKVWALSCVCNWPPCARRCTQQGATDPTHLQTVHTHSLCTLFIFTLLLHSLRRQFITRAIIIISLCCCFYKDNNSPPIRMWALTSTIQVIWHYLCFMIMHIFPKNNLLWEKCNIKDTDMEDCDNKTHRELKWKDCSR